MSGADYIICGGDTRPGPRDACSDSLHDYPLPAGYCDRSAEAMSRLSRGWTSRRCRKCGLYGWMPWLPDGGHATRVPFDADPTPCTACVATNCDACDGRTWDRDADDYTACPCAGAGHG